MFETPKPSINIVPMAGVMLALMAATVSSLPTSPAASILDMPPPITGCCEPVEPGLAIEMDQGGRLVVVYPDGTRQAAPRTEAEAVATALGEVQLQAHPDTPYGEFAGLVSALDDAGVRVVLINEDLE